MADPQKLRNLKIKIGVVKRYTKEKQSYEKEADDQQRKIDKFVEDGKDESFLKQQRDCLKESVMMVPDIQRKLDEAVTELKAIIAEGSEAFGEEEYGIALSAIENAIPHMSA